MRTQGVASCPEALSPPEERLRRAAPPFPGQQPAPKQEAEPAFDREQIRDILDSVEGVALALGRRLKFEYQKDADLYQVHVMEMGTDQVIRKIPSDEILKLVANMQRLLGMLMDTQA